MTANPLKSHAGPSRSPTDPQDCCDWANARLTADQAAAVQWVVTGDRARPIALQRL